MSVLDHEQLNWRCDISNLFSTLLVMMSCMLISCNLLMENGDEASLEFNDKTIPEDIAN